MIALANNPQSAEVSKALKSFTVNAEHLNQGFAVNPSMVTALKSGKLLQACGPKSPKKPTPVPCPVNW